MSEREQLARVLWETFFNKANQDEEAWEALRSVYEAKADAILAAGFRYAPTTIRALLAEYDPPGGALTTDPLFHALLADLRELVR